MHHFWGEDIAKLKLSVPDDEIHALVGSVSKRIDLAKAQQVQSYHLGCNRLYNLSFGFSSLESHRKMNPKLRYLLLEALFI